MIVLSINMWTEGTDLSYTLVEILVCLLIDNICFVLKVNSGTSQMICMKKIWDSSEVSVKKNYSFHRKDGNLLGHVQQRDGRRGGG